MEFRLLGPLEVSENGRPVELGGAKERTLLAVLLLHANETVSTERLVDELWGDEAPPTAPKLVRTYVWQLRKTVGEVIVTRPAGYVAVVPRGGRDVDRFDELVGRAQREAPAQAAATLREALALWRGPPLEDVRFASFAQHEVERLEDQRLAAVAQRIDHDLALGRHQSVLAELQALVAGNQYRERFRAQLMLALYRCGRQADALETYRDARRRFADELGIEPGPELQRLQRAILDHDPELDVPAPTEASPGVAGAERAAEDGRPDLSPVEPAAEAPRTPRRRRGILVGIGAALAVAAAAVGFVSVSRDDAHLGEISQNSVGLIDPQTVKIIREVRVGERPVAADAAAGTLWVANYADDSVTRIDEGTGATDTIPVGGHPTALEADRNGVWVLRSDDRTLVRVDRRWGYHAGAPVQLDATSVAASGSSLWVTQYDTTLQRLDAAGRPRGDPLLLDAGARAVVGSGGTIWVVGPRALTSVDAASGIPSPPIDLLGRATAIAADSEHVWIGVHAEDGTGAGFVQKIDADEERAAAAVAVASPPRALAVAAGYVWLANSDKTLTRLRAHDLSVAGLVELDGRPSALASGEAGLWVAVE